MQTELINLTKDVQITVTKNTQFVISFSQSPPAAPISLTLELSQPNVTAEIIGIYKLKSDQKISLTTIAHHKAQHTSCVTNIKGVLYDSSQSNYVGKIFIDKSAQQTSSFLNDDILMLGDNVKNHAEPILEIEADDVKASHGSTSGRIDENQIYYLESRGLTKKEAQGIIVEGFFEILIGSIKDSEIRQITRNSITHE